MQARTVYGPQLHYGPYTVLAWIDQFVNCHIALIAMFYLLNINVNFVLAITTLRQSKGVVLLAKLSQTVLTSSAFIR